jgi:D-beta-D-heptose 7-phosphate kinase/D-beta-D-heptose 1-phosphate adenosyltransferase
MIYRSRLADILHRAQDVRVLVAGDLMLDEFVWGNVARISPEAPVPIVEVTRETEYAGGAANVARNLTAFAGSTAVMGVTGQDAAAGRLLRLLEADGIDTGAVHACAGRPTTIKTRVIARHQQVVRVDRERRCEPPDEVRIRCLDELRTMLPSLDAVVLSDYGKGFLQPAFALEICRICASAGAIVAVDPNPGNPVQWANVTVVKPNRSEAFHAAAMDHRIAEPDALDEVATRLLEKWCARMLLITLGEDGMLLADASGDRYHTPTKAREVFDVSGAGDTAIALFTVALAAGATPREAAEIANHASGVVVGKLGTATLTADELAASFENA